MCYGIKESCYPKAHIEIPSICLQQAGIIPLCLVTAEMSGTNAGSHVCVRVCVCGHTMLLPSNFVKLLSGN